MQLRTILLLTSISLCTGSVFSSQPTSYRDPAQARLFKKLHPCPGTGKIQRSCPGYVVDHIIALECKGLDAPSNMQWQTIADGKAKDKIERIGCTSQLKH